MADLETITETLRRQRRDLEELINGTSKGSEETADLLRRIEELKRRSEQTQRHFEMPVRDPEG